MSQITILDSFAVNPDTIYNTLYKYLMDNKRTNMILIGMAPTSELGVFNLSGNNKAIEVEHWYTDGWVFHADEFLQNKGIMEEDEDPISFNLNPEFLKSLYVVKIAHTGKWYLASFDEYNNYYGLIKFVPDSIAFKPIKLDNSSNKNLIQDCFDHNHYNTPRICNCSKLLNVRMKTRVDDIMLEYIDDYEVEPYTENYEETEENTELNYLGQFPVDFLIDKIKEGAEQYGDEINMKLLESYKKQYTHNLNRLNIVVKEYLSSPDTVSTKTKAQTGIFSGTATQIYMQSTPDLKPTPVPKNLFL